MTTEQQLPKQLGWQAEPTTHQDVSKHCTSADKGRGLTKTSLIIGTAASPTVDRHSPKKREKVMIPRMFMFTAAAATLSGNILRTTSRRASIAVRCTAGTAAVGAAGSRLCKSSGTILKL